MYINKMGYDHLEFGKNCQDAGIFIETEGGNGNFALICDGCSEGNHSEVGAKLFTHLVKKSVESSDKGSFEFNENFQKIIDLLGNDSSAVKNYMCFTTVLLKKQDDIFQVGHCGDGFVILQDDNGNISFEELTDGEYPKYLAYNFIDRSHLSHYTEGVQFSWKQYDAGYKKVGIASDGLRYIVNCADKDLKIKDEFIEILKSGSQVKMQRFINKHHKLFKDDITLYF